jgi:proline dehydrogenase
MQRPLPGPPTGHTRAHYGFPVVASLLPARTLGRALTGRCVAGPQVDDAVRVAAELVRSGFRVALEHAPAPERDMREFGELIGRVSAAGIASACELTLPIDRLGAAPARTLAAMAADAGLRVALAGADGPVRAAADDLFEATVVVPAGRPDAETACRTRVDRRVRLTAGRGAGADLAFVRCLNVLMAGGGHPAIATVDPRLVAIAVERAAWNDRSPDTWEFVMTYGLRTEQQRRLQAAGYAVRVAVPSGPGAAVALVRSLAGRA